MKNRFIRLLISAAMAVSAASFAGCGAPDTSETSGITVPVSVVIVAAEVSNAAPVDLEYAQEEIRQAVNTAGEVYVIEADADPFVAYSAKFDLPEASLKKTYRTQKVNSKAKSFMNEAYEHLIPSAGETDTFKAIQKAAKMLKDMEGEKHLVIISYGVNTSGVCSFVNTKIHDTDPSETASALEKAGELNFTLKDVIIDWYGIGETDRTSEQVLYNRDVEILEQTYTKIFENRNAVCHFHYTAAASLNRDRSAYPAVTVIDTGAPESTVMHYSGSEAVEFPERVMAFIADSAELKDPENAVHALSEVIAFLEEHTDHNILIAGMTATVGDPEYARHLSLKRAETVCGLFTDAGVSGSRITCVGLGYDPNEFRTEDTDTEGILIEAKASANRMIIILPDEQKYRRKIGI